jgi:hypothetical protein
MTSDIKHYITYTICAITFIIIGGYTLFQLRHIIDGPSISLLQVKSGELVHDAVFPISGVATNIRAIEINDRPAFMDEAGKFTDVILLSEGYNVVVVTGEDKFKRKTEQRIELVYKKSAQDTATATSSKKVVATNNVKQYRSEN